MKILNDSLKLNTEFLCYLSCEVRNCIHVSIYWCLEKVNCVCGYDCIVFSSNRLWHFFLKSAKLSDELFFETLILWEHFS